MSFQSKGLRSELARELQAAGWSLRIRKGSGHIMATHPEASSPMFFASTPSDRRQPKHVRTQAARLLRKN